MTVTKKIIQKSIRAWKKEKALNEKAIFSLRWCTDSAAFCEKAKAPAQMPEYSDSRAEA